MPPTRRLPTARRRDQFAQAALRLAAAGGLRAVTAAALAQEVGVSAGAVFRHFATLDDLMQEAVAAGLAAVEGTYPDPAGAPVDRIAALARARIRLFRADPGVAWLLRSDEAHVALPEDAVEQLRATVRRSRRTLAAAIREGIADGSVRSDIAPESLLVLVAGAIHALVGTPGVHRTATRRPSVDRVVDDLMTMLAPAGVEKEKFR